MKIAMTGVSGNMGREALKQALELKEVDRVRVLLSPKKKNNRLARRLYSKYQNRIEVVRGSVADAAACRMLVKDTDYVVHMAAVIPPASDASAKRSFESNAMGTVTLVNAVKELHRQPKLIHISTVALYGNRNELHPWGRVGDPLLVSPFDAYAMHKLYGERCVLEAELSCWVVLRQTAMLHPNMMNDNVSDGLMFHTALNAPLEWVSSRDSGYLIKRILERDARGEINGFWKKIYNIGAGERCRETGYDTFNDGFSIIGGTTEKFFKPDWFASRNFHGLWFADGDELQKLFSYQRDDVHAYWQEIARTHKIFGLGKIVPAKLIHLCLFRRLLKHPNSPRSWIRRGDRARVQAYFGGEEGVKALPGDWKDVKLMAKGDFGDYDKLRNAEYARERGLLLEHGYDESIPQEEWSEKELGDAAAFRGGQYLQGFAGDAYAKAQWRCGRGHEFTATPYTVLRGGHWCPVCCQPSPWEFDALAKEIPFFAQVWYDSHGKDENYRYEMDEDGNASVERQ